jgi:hypothetical protein
MNIVASHTTLVLFAKKKKNLCLFWMLPVTLMVVHISIYIYILYIYIFLFIK